MFSQILRKFGKLWGPPVGAIFSNSFTSVVTVGMELLMGYELTGELIPFRLMYNGLKYGLAPVSTLITDGIREKFPSFGESRWVRVKADGLALYLYEMPLYVFCAAKWGGGKWWQIAVICAWNIVTHLAFGRLIYGTVLDWIRSGRAHEWTRSYLKFSKPASRPVV